MLWALPKKNVKSGSYDGRTAMTSATASPAKSKIIKRPFTLSWQQQFPAPAHPDEVPSHVYVPTFSTKMFYPSSAVDTAASTNNKVGPTDLARPRARRVVS
ncbi:hypothetical protein NP493_3522g00004 [Ridgeia piscesae]|uniref:Uncharacterized protein n=1 Tax=Ridgeia piscesae TaxID=27915 RepID=A0AAD9J616_RIDPI|nr:hypothetical protein NP493_3522g00004 [Ridgeia piscesae]